MIYLVGSIVVGTLDVVHSILLLRNKGHLRASSTLFENSALLWLVVSGVVVFTTDSAVVRWLSVSYLVYCSASLVWLVCYYRKEFKTQFSDSPVPMSQWPPVPLWATLAGLTCGAIFAGASGVCLVLT